MEDIYQTEVIGPGDRASILGKDVCVSSFKNNGALKVIPRQPENFRGPVDLAWERHILLAMLNGEITWQTQNDGAGGKPQFFTLIGTDTVFARLGWEMLVMVIDDHARSGGFPAAIMNDVNAKKVTEKNYHLVVAMFEGLKKILRKTNIVNGTGEFAIMKHSVTAFCDMDSDEQLILNWAGAGIGLTHRDKIIDGTGTKAGMPVVGFWEPGYRCNGGTRFTELILRMVDGVVADIWKSPELMEFIYELTTPSISYAKTICRVNGWLPDGQTTEPMAKIVCNSHNTGGGFGKFKEALPKGIGARLNNMFKPAKVLLDAQKMSFDFPDLRISDEAAHTVFHGGCGWVSVCPSYADACILIAEAEKDGIEAQVIGETTDSDSNILEIDSTFLEGTKNMKL